MAVKKKQNIIKRYFLPFGLRQVCDISMFAAFVLLIVGLIIYPTASMVLPIGLGLFIFGGCLALFRSVKVMKSEINHRSPEYKHALVNAIIMVVLTALAIFAMIWFFIYQI